jgi:hypothetical protein
MPNASRLAEKRAIMDKVLPLFLTRECLWNQSYQLRDARLLTITLTRAATKSKPKPAVLRLRPQLFVKGARVKVNQTWDGASTSRGVFAYSCSQYDGHRVRTKSGDVARVTHEIR